MSKVLVTGGLGFIGSNLVDILVEQGHEVTIIDNLSSISSKLSYSNKNATYVLGDIKDIKTLLENLSFDTIFHLAAEARIQPSFDNPNHWFKSNSSGTMDVLEYARQNNIKSFVYATTSSKNHQEGHLLTPYTFSKVVGEDACRLYANIYKMNIGIATFYNVYGPREPEEGEFATVVAKFNRQYTNNEQLTIVGTGNQTRDFTHVYDICMGLIKISEGEWKAENFDLGKGEPISILDVAKSYVGNMLSRISYIPLRKNEGMHTKSNWKQTEKKLHWRATHNLLEYITKNK